ncbi:MAG: histone deacetylase [Gammaproteobacteria bacterium]|nr:MAG: histone deacetylase [Gammaproteobacteria bacterium]RKZ96573.1 MAG: histone deacetylase [Gammaproteobacteria bacterium]RLA01230.1 MAG: histone deacetylase [Gammaproteobacteria bacterium]
MERRQFLALSIFTILSESSGAKQKRLPTGLVLDDRFSEHQISPEHPESPARYNAIKQQLQAKGLLNETVAIKPLIDAEQWLSLVHSDQHISSIKTQQQNTHNNAVLATAGVLAAVNEVCSGRVSNAFCASRPPGHHALNTGKEEGFCYYNHIAIAARYAQQHCGIKKVLIVDWDYHHGNGTEWAFYSDPNVLYFSTHDVFAYPGTGFPEKKGEGAGEGFNINVHLACGASDEDIIKAFQQQLLPAVEQFSPDLILISAGFDSRQDDLLGCHNITDQGFTKLTEMVRALADKYCQGKIVSLLEGGYNIEGNATAVSTHITALMS